MIEFIGLANFNAINLASSGLLNSPLVHHLIGHEIMHSFFSVIRKTKGKRLTRAQRRRMMNRRRRWFTDNIIMHHKRLHDKNRQIVIASAKTKIAARKLARTTPEIPEENRKWRDKVEVRDRGRTIRGRVDARRLRARSRWLSVAELSR